MTSKHVIPKRRSPIEFAMVMTLAAIAGGPQMVIPGIALLIAGLYIKDFFRDDLQPES